jgi:hypothetical protein
MNLYEEIELQEMQRAVDSLATENQMLQEPKTPTEEQIEKIDKVWGNTFGREWDITPIEDLIKVTITEWEKIRNQ